MRSRKRLGVFSGNPNGPEEIWGLQGPPPATPRLLDRIVAAPTSLNVLDTSVYRRVPSKVDIGTVVGRCVVVNAHSGTLPIANLLDKPVKAS
jgi:hypothetical protein